jgi:hypothetical protein
MSILVFLTGGPAKLPWICAKSSVFLSTFRKYPSAVRTSSVRNIKDSKSEFSKSEISKKCQAQ